MVHSQNNVRVLLSIIVPCYNVESYINECLSSLVSSESQEVEFIIIDDGSTDNTAREIEIFTKDERVTLYRTKNAGLSAARNLGYAKSNGEYVLYLDSDDYIEGDLSEIVSKIRASKVGTTFVLDTIDFEDGTNDVISEFNLDKNIKGTAFDLYTRGQIRYVVWNKVLCRKNIESSKCIFPIGRVMEDLPYLATYFSKASTDIIHSNVKVYHRNRAKSIITTPSKKNIDDTLTSYFDVIKLNEKNDNGRLFLNLYSSRINEILFNVYSGNSLKFKVKLSFYTFFSFFKAALKSNVRMVVIIKYLLCNVRLLIKLLVEK